MLFSNGCELFLINVSKYNGCYLTEPVLTHSQHLLSRKTNKLFTTANLAFHFIKRVFRDVYFTGFWAWWKKKTFTYSCHIFMEYDVKANLQNFVSLLICLVFYILSLICDNPIIKPQTEDRSHIHFQNRIL